MEHNTLLIIHVQIYRLIGLLIHVESVLSVFTSLLDAAGNFLCPAEGLSFNAFRTVMDIDTNGTFNVTKVVFDEYMKVRSNSRVRYENVLYSLH